MSLSTQQEQVLASIAAGQTATVAAAGAGVHRNTVSNWMRDSGRFREALASAQSYQRTHWREQAETRAAAAFTALDEILADPKAPAGVRARVAMAILNMASATHEPRKETLYCDVLGSEQPLSDALAEIDALATAPPPPRQKPENLHNFAQIPVAPPPQNPGPNHKSTAWDKWIEALDDQPLPFAPAKGD